MSIVIADLVARIHADTTDVKQGIRDTAADLQDLSQQSSTVTIKADTTGVQQGAQAAAQGLQGVQNQAEQTARALEIMAAQFAKLHGGTKEEALDLFQRSGAQPTTAAMDQAARVAAQTAAQTTARSSSQDNSARQIDRDRADAMAAAQQRAERDARLEGRSFNRVQTGATVQPFNTAEEAEKTVAPTQAAARAAEDVGKGWSASEASVVRFGTALLGVNLGLSLVAGAARLVHAAIVDVVDRQIAWEQSIVRVHSLYGALGPGVIAMSQAQAQAPGLLGSQQEFLTANLNTAYLTNRFGVSQQDTFGLTSAAGRVSNAFGFDAQRQADIQARALAFAEGGGSSLRDISGTSGDPLAISRRLGGVSPAQLQALTPQQLREAQTQIAALDLNQTALGASDVGKPGLLELQTLREKALTEAQSNLQNALEGGVGAGAVGSGGVAGQSELARMSNFPGILGGAGELQQRGDLGLGPGSGNPEEPNLSQRQARIDATQKAVEEANSALALNTAALGDSRKATEDAAVALSKLGIEAGTAAFKLLGFTGNIEERTSIARLDVGAQAQSAVASRAVGPNPLVYQTPAEILAQATERASQDAYRAFVAPQAQRALQANQAIRQQFEQQANTAGPGDDLESQRASAQAALDDLNRRQGAESARLQAQQAGGLAARAQAESQSQLSAISIQQDERRLAVAEELAGYQTQSLQIQGQLAPLMLQQANLQDRMVVAARDNLTSRRELISAEQQQLAVTQVTSAYDYEQQRLELRAEQSRATVAAGGAPTEDINALRQQYRGTELQRAASGVDIEALDANRQVQVVGQQRTAEDLTRQGPLTNLEAEGRALQDLQIPLDQNLRAVQAHEATIQRTLTLMDLQDTKAVTAAQHALNSAGLLAIQAAAAERSAGDLAAGLDLGATAAERAQKALSLGYQAVNDTATALAGVRDMLNTMPSLIVPIAAAADANGGASVPTPPGPSVPSSDALQPTPERAGQSTLLQTPPPVPRAPAVNPTPDRQPEPVSRQPQLVGAAGQLANPGGGLSVSVPLTINGSSQQDTRNQVHQAVEDALNNFFSGASTAGAPASNSVGGNGR